MKIKSVLSHQRIGGLNIVQFRADLADTFQYTASASALERKLVQVTEVSQQGSVNYLLVENVSDQFVFFMDGDILAGAKQNRVLNSSILLAPKTRTIIPVSCVERGRWRFVSPQFASTDHSAPASLREYKARILARKMGKPMDHMADQAGVWEHVSHLKTSSGAAAPTDNLSDIFAGKKIDLDTKMAALSPAAGANCVAIFWEDRLLSLDIFNRCEVLADYLPKLVRGVLIESLQSKSSQNSVSSPQLEETIQRVLVESTGAGETGPSVGAGRERRFERPEVVGFELDYEQHPIHLSILGKGRA